MKFLPLVWAGAWRKPGRAVLMIFSIANAFLLFGLLQGFAGGLRDAAGAAHADVLFATSRVSQSEPLPLAYARQIQAMPGVLAVSPLLSLQGYYRDERERIRAFALDPAQLPGITPALRMAAPQLTAFQQTRDGAVVSEEMARRYGWRVGDQVPLRSRVWVNRDGATTWPVRIVGTFTSEGSSVLDNAMLFHFAYLDEGRTRDNGMANGFMVRVRDPAQADTVAQRIDRQFANSIYETKTANEQEFARDAVKAIGNVGFLVAAVVGAVFFALLFSVGAILMQAIRERTTELAVLKSIGFTSGEVLVLITAEALLICLGSAVLGLALSLLAFPPLAQAIGFPAVSSTSALLPGVLFAIGLALLSGLPPGVRAMRLRIADALLGQ